MVNNIEILKLIGMLVNRKIDFQFRPLYDGYQVIGDGWDVVCHEFSYGADEGLLEAMWNNSGEDSDVEGYLTAENVLKKVLKNS